MRVCSLRFRKGNLSNSLLTQEFNFWLEETFFFNLNKLNLNTSLKRQGKLLPYSPSQLRILQISSPMSFPEEVTGSHVVQPLGYRAPFLRASITVCNVVCICFMTSLMSIYSNVNNNNQCILSAYSDSRHWILYLKSCFVQ